MISLFTRTRAASTRVAHPAAKPAVEPLEARQMLHGGCGIGGPGSLEDLEPGAAISDNGVLTVVGTEDATNTISVSLSADGASVVTNIGGTEETFALADIERVLVVGGDLADVITVSLDSDDFDGRVSIYGGFGDDQITAGDEDDHISGGDGADTIVAGGGENRVDGGDGNDTLTGGADQDYLGGGAGNDNLNGGDGDDRLDGGTGDDTLVGGAGDDRLTAGTGTDSLSGGDGDDTLVGTDGVDTLDGGAGENEIVEERGRGGRGARGAGRLPGGRALGLFGRFGR